MCSGTTCACSKNKTLFLYYFILNVFSLNGKAIEMWGSHCVAGGRVQELSGPSQRIIWHMTSCVTVTCQLKNSMLFGAGQRSVHCVTTLLKRGWQRSQQIKLMCVCVCQHMSVHARPECTVSLSECVKEEKTASEEERREQTVRPGVKSPEHMMSHITWPVRCYQAMAFIVGIIILFRISKCHR